MKLIGLVRLGRDAEIRYSNDGKPVASFSGAFNYGRKDSDGKRPTQWVDFSMWGERAEKLAPYLVKGSAVVVTASELHVETYERRDGGEGTKLVARVDDVELTGSPQDGERSTRSEAPPAQTRAPRPAAAAKSSRQIEDDDIPF